MFFGVSALQTFHVLVSLIGILSGIVVLYGLVTARRMDATTGLFLGSTLITLLSGFVFPFKGFTPAIGVGIIGTFVIAVALYARYRCQMAGSWRGIYVITAVLSLYFNVFVLIVQLFLKIPGLKALAPTGSEPPFVAAQSLALIAFLIVGYFAYRRFRPAAMLSVTSPA